MTDNYLRNINKSCSLDPDKPWLSPSFYQGLDCKFKTVHRMSDRKLSPRNVLKYQLWV